MEVKYLNRDWPAIDEPLNLKISSTESINSAPIRNDNKVLIQLIAGSLLFVPSDSFCNINEKISFTETNSSLEDFLKSYHSTIVAETTYLSELETVFPVINYTKSLFLQQIMSFRYLCDDWDGHGAIPAEAQSSSNAIQVFDFIGESIAGRAIDVFPNPNGTITIIWENSLSDKVNVEIGNSAMSYYIEINGLEEYFNDKKINRREGEKLKEFINSL